jgi:hypothetical protein
MTTNSLSQAVDDILNESQKQVYDIVSQFGYIFSFQRLEDLQKKYTKEFLDVTEEIFNAEYKDNEVAVIRRVFPKETTGLTDEDVLLYRPRGDFPIVGYEEYLRYARILGNVDIFRDPASLDGATDLLERVGQEKLRQMTAAITDSINQNLVALMFDAVSSVKDHLIVGIKDVLGVGELNPIKGATPTISPQKIPAREEVFEEELVTNEVTAKEEADKIPHQIRSFGEPKSTAAPEYPHNHITQTPGGHIVELDDTPAAPRVRIQHTNGSKMEIDADGNHIIKSTADKYDIVNENHYKYVKGHATEVTDGKAMKTYTKGVQYNTDNMQTFASARVHFQTPLLSFTEMLLGKNAVLSNNLLVKQALTVRNIRTEEKLTSPAATIDNLKVDTNVTSPKGTIKTLKGQWANTLARESQVSWVAYDISTGSPGGSAGDIAGSSMNAAEQESDSPTRSAANSFDETRAIINQSIRFKEGAAGSPTFVKKAKFDQPIQFGASANDTIEVRGGMLYVGGQAWPHN